MKRGERGQGEVIQCKGHVIGLFHHGWSRRLGPVGEGRAATCRRRASHPVAPGLQRVRDQGEQARKHHFVSDSGPRSGHDD